MVSRQSYAISAGIAAYFAEQVQYKLIDIGAPNDLQLTIWGNRQV